MTDAEMQALRAAAEKATVPQSAYSLWRDGGPLDDFRGVATPAAVLALLDRVAAAERERDHEQSEATKWAEHWNEMRAARDAAKADLAAAAATCDAVAVEREACAAIADKFESDADPDAGAVIAAAIRARGRASA